MLQALGRTTATSGRGAQQRRALFNLPKFSSADSPHGQSYHERKILPYRRSELYKIIADVESYPIFVPYCVGSRVLESKALRDGITVMEAELTVGFLAFRESYVSTVTCKPHESVEAVASSSTSLFKTLTTVWRLQPVPSRTQDVYETGPTVVTLDLAFAFTNPVHTSVSATFFAQVSKLMVKAFEERCTALYG